MMTKLSQVCIRKPNYTVYTQKNKPKQIFGNYKKKKILTFLFILRDQNLEWKLANCCED